MLNRIIKSNALMNASQLHKGMEWEGKKRKAVRTIKSYAEWCYQTECLHSTDPQFSDFICKKLYISVASTAVPVVDATHFCWNSCRSFRWNLCTWCLLGGSARISQTWKFQPSEIQAQLDVKVQIRKEFPLLLHSIFKKLIFIVQKLPRIFLTRISRNPQPHLEFFIDLSLV